MARPGSDPHSLTTFGTGHRWCSHVRWVWLPTAEGVPRAGGGALGRKECFLALGATGASYTGWGATARVAEGAKRAPHPNGLSIGKGGMGRLAADRPPLVTHNCTRVHGVVLAQVEVLRREGRAPGGSLGMSLKGHSQRSSEPFTATQSQRAPIPFPSWGRERGGCAGEGGGLVLWEGESTCSLICSSSPFVWERRTTCWVNMRVPDPKVLDLQHPPPIREARDLARQVPACSKGAKGMPGAKGEWGCVGPVTHSVPLLWGGGGWGGS